MKKVPAEQLESLYLLWRLSVKALSFFAFGLPSSAFALAIASALACSLALVSFSSAWDNAASYDRIFSSAWALVAAISSLA